MIYSNVSTLKGASNIAKALEYYCENVSDNVYWAVQTYIQGITSGSLTATSDIRAQVKKVFETVRLDYDADEVLKIYL